MKEGALPLLLTTVTRSFKEALYNYKPHRKKIEANQKQLDGYV